MGVAGAVANQPPAPSAAPINGANPAPQAAGQQQGTDSGSSKRESTTNYEVDKTVRVTRGNNWAIKRVNAAVVINYQSVTDNKGKVENKPLSAEQLEQMTALVRETVGYNKDRGDSVNLMNAPFQPATVVADDTPLWKQPETVELARNLAWPLGMSLFAAMVLLGLVRPALKALGQPKAIPMAGAQLDAVEADTPERPALPAPAKQDQQAVATPEQLRLEEARALARSNPVAVANIVKNWVNGDVA